MKTKKIRLIFNLLILLCLCVFSTTLFACSNSSNKNGDDDDVETNVTGSIVLDKEMITLEKREIYTLTATLNEVQGEITWSSSDSSIATVLGGKITAIKAGQAMVTASIDEVKAICYIFVEGNNQNIVISANFSDNQNMVQHDQKSIIVSAFYNNKSLPDANITYSVLGGEKIFHN